MRLAELILTEMRAMDGVASAYSLARVVSTKRHSRIAPNSIYRALARLIDKGLVRRVESRNGFIANPGDAGSILSICIRCNQTVWLDDEGAHDRLHDIAEKAGFKAKRLVIEMTGFCEKCSHPTQFTSA
ncbi:MAG: Fur family transcriptional regulator [Sphingorhabdus sp.]